MILSSQDLIILIREAQLGDEEAFAKLLNRYHGFILKKCRRYFGPGLSLDDWIQEGQIAFMKAVRDYSFLKESAFTSFASLCIDRHLKGVLKGSKRLKHGFLNDSDSLEVMADREVEGMAVINLKDRRSLDPIDEIINNCDFDDLTAWLAENLSSYEKKVLALRIQNFNYVEIAERLGREVKSVDNTLLRIRGKIRKGYQKIHERSYS